MELPLPQGEENTKERKTDETHERKREGEKRDSVTANGGAATGKARGLCYVKVEEDRGKREGRKKDCFTFFGNPNIVNNPSKCKSNQGGGSYSRNPFTIRLTQHLVPYGKLV